MISQIKHLYSNISIQGNPNSKISVIAHKDRVGFFVWKKLEKNEYLIYVYGNIPNDTISNTQNLYTKKLGVIDIQIVEINEKFIHIRSSSPLTQDDFLMYPPNYRIENNTLIGPYLDNIISTYTITQFSFSDFEIYQSFDEEALLKYSEYPKKNISIILDTIWQDYIDDPLDMTKIYNVCGTRYSKDLIKIEDTDIIPIQLNMPFRLECDVINHGKIIYLLCPITSGHSQESTLNIDTLNKFELILSKVLKIYG